MITNRILHTVNRYMYVCMYVCIIVANNNKNIQLITTDKA